jgi:hypothetical protein
MAIAVCLPSLWCWPLLIFLALDSVFRLKRQRDFDYLQTQQDGSIVLHAANGAVISAWIKADSVIYPFLVILHLQYVESTAYPSRILIWQDCTDISAFRHLRIWLKWGWNQPT